MQVCHKIDCVQVRNARHDTASHDRRRATMLPLVVQLQTSSFDLLQTLLTWPAFVQCNNEGVHGEFQTLAEAMFYKRFCYSVCYVVYCCSYVHELE